MKSFSRTSCVFGILAVGLLAIFPELARGMPGDLDATFGVDGRVSTAFSGSRAGASDAALQPDGKIVVAGSVAPFPGGYENVAVTRYLTDGSLDVSFGNGGKVSTSVGLFNYVSGMAIQGDGKIVVVGRASGVGQTYHFAVIRYETNGALDMSFDADGKAIIDMGDYSFANDVAIQPDGRIVIVGGSGINESRNFSFSVVRLNSDGSLDSSFGSYGKVITSLGAFSDTGAMAVAFQPDGKIIAAGQSGTGNFATADLAIVRYNRDGTLDVSFDGDGKVMTAVTSGYDIGLGLAIQSDGKIVTAGGNFSGFAVVRYYADGSLDTSFDGDGIALTTINYHATSVAIQTNGKIVAAGRGSGRAEFLLIRYNPNGSLDTSFGGDGLVTTRFDDTGGGAVHGLVIQPDGNIVAAGYWGQAGKDLVFAVARFAGDSAISNRNLFDFDGDGKSDISVFRPSDGVWRLNQSTAGFSATQFGISTDQVAPADFDGDGKTDIAVFRAPFWYWVNSSTGTFQSHEFGYEGAVAVPADYTGDGRADLALYGCGFWSFLDGDPANNGFQYVQFGIATDKPVPGDYDGDGAADFAVNRDGTWYVLQSSHGFTAIQFGLPTDMLVPADYDGDAKTDIAVFRPSNGTWYLQRSRLGFTAIPFGLGSDVPVPADYDGDGKTDIAVFRQPGGIWYQLNTTHGFNAVQFGANGDRPIRKEVLVGNPSYTTCNGTWDY